MTAVGIALAWLALSLLFAVAWSRALGRRSPEEQTRDDAEQMEALTHWRAYEEHA